MTSESSFIERLELPTGVPRVVREYEHTNRYRWACSLVHGDVLDIACGTGFGSQMLSARCRVVGIDVNEQAVESARQRSDGRFLVASVPPIPLDDDSFDAVVSFETVEHIEDDVGFVRELRRVLRAGGTAVISTPNKAVTSSSGPPPNPFHIREYLLPEMTQLVRDAGFTEIETFAQVGPATGVRRLGRSAAWRLRSVGPAGGLAYRLSSRLLFGWLDVRPWDGHEEPTYWVLACR